jgi:hypothetical protein
MADKKPPKSHSKTPSIKVSPRHPVNFPQQTSGYVPISPGQNLFYVEPNMSHLESPEDLAKAYFPPSWHFAPVHPAKSPAYYRDILRDTESIRIKSTYDKSDQTKLIHHSLYIHKIVSQKDWGSHPYTLRNLNNHPVQYSYHDYIDAWYKILLYQNENFSHSWSINFDKKFRGQFPLWFLSWWSAHGPVHELIPAQLQDSVIYFSTVFNWSEHKAKFPILMHFMGKYKVPWILKWHYEVNSDVVTRRFSVKWWEKFNHDRIISQVNSEFPLVNLELPKPSRLNTFASSSLSIEGRSKSKLKELATQFKGRSKSKLIEILQQVIQMGEDEDESTSPASSEAPSTGQAMGEDEDEYFFNPF